MNRFYRTYFPVVHLYRYPTVACEELQSPPVSILDYNQVLSVISWSLVIIQLAPRADRPSVPPQWFPSGARCPVKSIVFSNADFYVANKSQIKQKYICKNDFMLQKTSPATQFNATTHQK